MAAQSEKPLSDALPSSPSTSAPTTTSPSDPASTDTNRPIHNPWQQVRELWVQQELEDGDLDALRRISALPGGFAGLRKKVWPVLLRVHTDGAVGSDKPAAADDPQPPAIDAVAKSEQAEEAGSELSTIPGAQDGHLEPESGSSSRPSSPDGLPLHKDEHQVHLDTNRSFVTYPRGLTPENKLAMQADLDDLIVRVLRKYPKLSYFQGYHDILSVLYLTFIPPKALPPPRRRAKSRGARSRSRSRHASGEGVPSEKIDQVGENGDAEKSALDEKVDDGMAGRWRSFSPIRSPSFDDTPTASSSRASTPQLPVDEDTRDTPEWQELRLCAEAVSLHRVRDAMGSGMEGMMGLLRILKNLLRVADPALSRFASSISPIPTLPFFALSWVLTIFSHDCDELEPVQRVFDWVLGRNPVAGVYLAAAILITKKPQMLKIAKSLGPEYEQDPSLLHPLFTRLPPLYPDTPAAPSPPPPSPSPIPSSRTSREQDEANPYDPLPLSRVFALADELMERFPWDGEAVRGRRIMGEGSVVRTYNREYKEDWTAEDALEMVDVDVVLPGAGMPPPSDDEDEDGSADLPPPSKRRRPLPLRLPRNRLGTALALGVLLVGVGIAVYGVKAGAGAGSVGGTGWKRWWGAVVRGWVGREGRKVWGGLRDVL
ncbi:hypothetical protein IAT38_003562 [Cryptococcus sp. DSM 104549]